MTDKAAREARFGGGRPPKNLPGTAGGSSGAVTRQDDFAFSGTVPLARPEGGNGNPPAAFFFCVPDPRRMGKLPYRQGFSGIYAAGIGRQDADRGFIPEVFETNQNRCRATEDQPFSPFPPRRGSACLRRGLLPAEIRHRSFRGSSAACFFEKYVRRRRSSLGCPLPCGFFANIRSSRKRLFPGKTPRKNECFSKKAGRKKGSPGNFDSLCPFFDVK